MPRFPASIMDTARDRGLGAPVAQYHTVRQLKVWQTAWLSLLIIFSGILLGSLLAAKVNAWLFWAGPALMLLLALLTPWLRWYWQPAETRRRFYLHEKGLVYASQAAAVAVPWEMVDEVIHRPESSRSYGGAATTYFEVLRIALRPGAVAESAGRLLELWPVAHQRAMTRDVRRLVGDAARWTELEPESLVDPALLGWPSPGRAPSARTSSPAPPDAPPAQPSGAAARHREALADAQADQARRREAARAALADRLASHEAKNATDADDLTTADREFADGQVRAAFERLLGLIQETSGEERDRARLRLLDLFDASPPQDPRVAGARASLSRLLF